MLQALLASARLFFQYLFFPFQRLRRKGCEVLRFTLEGAPPALPRRRGFPLLDRRQPPLSLRTLERRLRCVVEDEELGTVLVDIKRLEAGWATLETMHELLREVREAGKRVVAYLPEGGGVREYYVASAAGEVWIAPSAALSLTGLGVEATYLAQALEKAGLRAQVEAVGRYKTAGESLIKRQMTAENAEMLGAIVDELEGLVVGAVEVTRHLGPLTARALLGAGPYSPRRARELGLVDDVCYPDQLPSKLAPAGRTKARIRRWAIYARGRHLLGAFPFGRGHLPVLELSGVLVEGRNKGFKGLVGAADVVKQLQRLRKDRSVPAVVLAINSRGGTVGASDQIRREVERLGERKPVIAYLSNVAASGGYMVASAAHHVVAQPASLTGSIGVLAGKVSGRQLLERLGLHHQALRRGGHASFDSPAEGWSASERQALRELIAEHYRHFVEVVARGRRIPVEQVEASAEGRVWTGRQAKERGLVDQLGGLREAIAAARETSPMAKRALIQPLRPSVPRLPELLLPQALATALALAQLADSRATWAIEPLELRIR